MKHYLSCLIFLTGLLVGVRSKATGARGKILGPAGRAVANSAFGPIIPYHTNGLPGRPTFGFDLGYDNQDSFLVATETASTDADFSVYGAIPMFTFMRSQGPSGVTVKVSAKSSNATRDYHSFAWRDKQAAERLVGDLGFILAVSSSSALSLQISMNRFKQAGERRSARNIGGAVAVRRQTVSKASELVYFELGYRLRLTKNSSAALVYKPSAYAKNGITVREENSFVDDRTIDEYSEGRHSPGFLALSLRARARAPLTLMFGLERFFGPESDKESGELLLASASKLGLAMEYFIAKDRKFWIPRFGYEQQITGEGRYAMGLSILAGSLEYDVGAILVKRAAENSKNTGFQFIFGAGYHIREDHPRSFDA